MPESTNGAGVTKPHASNGSASPLGAPASQAPDKANDARKQNRPKPLRGDAVLVINTTAAQMVFFGRSAPRGAREAAKKRGGSGYRRNEIVGVPLFATLVQTVVKDAARNNPYADMHLLEIESAFNHAEEQLAKRAAEVEARLSGRTFIDLKVALSQKPLRKQLRFRSPYSYWAARLVADYDKLAVAILSAHHYAIISKRRSDEMLGGARKLLRDAFQLPRRYKIVDVTRDDIVNQTHAGVAAMEKFGPVPEDVLNRKKLPAFGPSALRDRSDEEHVQRDVNEIPDVL